MAASTNKKVLVARFDKAPLQGFVQFPEGVVGEQIELLTPAGSIHPVPSSEVKLISFLRDFEAGDIPSESWKRQRTFANRPKTAGLWVRLRLRDGDTLEGLLPNNLLLMEPIGVTVVPPDPSFQNQRVFVPRPALAAVEVLGVIGSPLRRAAKQADKADQLKMFD